MPLRILIPLACLALLCATLTSPAAAEPAPDDSVELEFEEIAESAEDEALEECEEVVEEFEEFEECEEVEEEEAGDPQPSDSAPAARCALRSASARVVLYAKKRQLKLTIDYTTHQPTDATISLRKGALALATIRRRLGRRGEIRLTDSLNPYQAGKLRAGDRVSVRIRVAGTPQECGRVGRLTPRLLPPPK